MKFEVKFVLKKRSLLVNKDKIISIVAQKQRNTPLNPDRVIRIMITDYQPAMKAHSIVHDGITLYIVAGSSRASENVTVTSLDDLESNLQRVLSAVHPIGYAQRWLVEA